MIGVKRNRRVHSIKEELLGKSREAALAAVQVFNNPNVTFKSETYIILMVVAWTYLLHAYYRGQNIDYRYFTQAGTRRHFDRTTHGAFKHWELEHCLDVPQCPLPSPVKKNLKFLIGLRHEIEHQMTTRIDDLLSARFQACCINYHQAIESLFGDDYGIAKHLSVSLQFASMEREQIETLGEHKGLPPHIRTFIEGFDGELSPEDFGSPKFAYRVIFVPKTANHLSQADQVITFVKSDSEIAKSVNAAYAVIRETERPKMLPSEIVRMMKSEGFRGFAMHHHTDLWKSLDARSQSKGFGVQVSKVWYWYEPWLKEVRKHCAENKAKYL
jgi:hypothetical protein